MSLQGPTPLERLPLRRKGPAEAPGALVLGGDYQGLGIARSLGRRGIPVGIVDDERSIAGYSRHATFSVRVPELRDGDVAAQLLRDLARRLDLSGWVIFPTRDEQVAALSMHKTELSRVYRVPTPAWDTVPWMWDKRKTYQLAGELEIPIPQTWTPESIDDVEKIDAAFPLALKPAIKEHFFYATKAKAWRADSKEELRALYRRGAELAGPGEIMIQDVIPGDGCNQFAFCAFFKNGQALGSMTARRRRQHPHDFGRASTYVESLDLPEVEALAVRFLQKIDYYGLVEVEFKLDPRDGKYKLLDVNARTWGYHTLGLAAGVDFPAMLYADQLGQPVEPRRARAGVSWVRLVTDTPTAFLDLIHGRLGLGRYARSLAGCSSDAVFSLRDPLPGLVECALIPYLALKRGF